MKNIKKQYSIGIDIGGTNMKAILFDGEKILADYLLATPRDNIDHFLIIIKALIDPLIEKAQQEKIKINGIGVSIAGVPNKEKTMILKSPNISIINGIDLIELINNKTNLPVTLDNDANCFLRAEALRGAGKNMKNIYGIIIGTGIGGAWWNNNKTYDGAHGGANEPGQMIIDFTDKIVLEEAYQKLNQNNPAKLAEEAYRGDQLAERSFEEIGELLGVSFANIANIINPEAFILGGGVIESSYLFFSEIKKATKKYIMSSEAKNTKIIKGKLGEHAGAIGASLLVK
jgi:glucokinase